MRRARDERGAMLDRRWKDGGAEPRHQRAAGLVSRLAEPRPLSPDQLARIEARLDEGAATPTRRRPSWRAAGVAVGVAAVAAACITAALLLPGGGPAGRAARVAVLDGDAVLGGDGRVVVGVGRIAARTGDAPLVVSTRSLALTVRPTSVVEVDGVLEKVACYQGEAEVRWVDGQLRVLHAPSVLSAAGLSPVDAAERERTLRALALVPATDGRGGVSMARPPASGEAPRAAGTALGPREAAAAARTAPAAPPAPPPRPPRKNAPTPLGVLSASAPPLAPPAAARPGAGSDVPPSAGEPPRDDDPKRAPPESAFAAETRLVSQAQKRLHLQRDAAGALALLDEHRARFPAGQLRPEAEEARLDALLVAGRRAEVLTLLDGRSLSGGGRVRERRVLRGELRAEAGRCAEASVDLRSSTEGQDRFAERALYGLARCRAVLGDEAGARADLALYLSRFPAGHFAAAARASLSP